MIMCPASGMTNTTVTNKSIKKSFSQVRRTTLMRIVVPEKKQTRIQLRVCNKPLRNTKLQSRRFNPLG